MNYEINYEDEKFQQVEADKQQALTNINNTYNNMINSSDQYYQPYGRSYQRRDFEARIKS